MNLRQETDMSVQQTTEIRELTAHELSDVSGGSPFFGMNCSQNQHNAIGAIRDAVGSIPIVGQGFAAIVTAVGRWICS
jgi:hypothetical protein